MLKTVSSIVNAIGALNYKGTWDANTNTPTLVSSVGTKGDYYVVSVAGSTNLNGETNWGVGDWAVFNGSVWQKVDGGSTGNFTDITVSNSATLSYGTANGVAYLNGSKVLTTGSALTFNGANFVVGGTYSAGYKLQSYAASGNQGISIVNGGNAGGDFAALSFIQGGTNTASIYTNGNNLTVNANTGAAAFQIGGSEQMRLTSTGLGIGTSSPAYPLHVVTSSTSVAAFRNSGAAISQALVGNTAGDLALRTLASGDALIFSDASKYLAFGSNGGTERMRITSAGDVGIGTSSPLSKLHVNGDIRSDGDINLIGGAGTPELRLYQNSGNWAIQNSAGNLLFYDMGAAATRVTVDGAGNLGLGVTPSAWNLGSLSRVIDVGAKSSFAAGGAGQPLVVDNAFFNGSSWIYKQTLAASYYQQNTGAHTWFTAPSGTAGNTISFTQSMTLSGTSDAVLLLGTTSSAYGTAGRGLFEVNGSSTALIAVKTGDTARGYFAASSSVTELAAIGASQPLVFTANGAERARIPSTGGFVVGTAALATNATTGFLYVPTCAGTPTGTPATQTGTAPIVVDTTNNKLYFYSGGQWRDAGP